MSDIEIAETHLRFRNLIDAQGWLEWHLKHSTKEVIPIQHYVPLDKVPEGKMNLVERKEWLHAPYCICIVNDIPQILRRNVESNTPIIESFAECQSIPEGDPK